MARRYHLSPLPPSGPAALDPAVSHHLARVMRVRVDEPVVLFDGDGRECEARVVAIDGRGREPRVSVQVGAHRTSAGEPATRVHVIFAPPRGSRAAWLFEHGTEVGIAHFHPVATERSLRPDRDAGPDRWRRIVTAATGQCDRGRIPEVHRIRPLAEVLADPDLPAERYLASRDADPIRAATSGQAVLLVGPEGGLTPAELLLAGEHRFLPRSLGPTTLRAETAVLAGAIHLLGP